MTANSHLTLVPEATRQSPYYDDFDANNNFYRILFRPGYAVQARELTQMQTMLQNQVAQFGQHVFKEGSIVLGGQISYSTVTSLNLATQYAGTDVDVSEFEGTQIINVNTATSIVRAQILAVEESNNSEPATLMIKYLSGAEFSANDTFKVSDEEVFANVAAVNVSTSGTITSIQDGVFFISGYFVNVPAQTIILDKYGTTPSYRVGLEITENILDQNDDTTLLDPAQEASNYQAPGATRYQIELTLAKRSLSSTDDSKFVELLRVEDGILTKQIVYPTYSELESTFARRTYDESGHYTVDPFLLSLTTNSNSTNNLIATLDPGKAYVMGYEFQTIAPTRLTVPKARDTTNVSGYDLAINYGNYVLVTNVNTTLGAASSGLLNIDDMQIMDMHCVDHANVATSNTTVYNASKMGTARLRSLTYETAANTDNGDTHVFRAYIFDTIFTTITGNANTATATTLQLANTANGADFIKYSNTINAYQNTVLTITSGLANGYVGFITAYNNDTRTITVEPPFTTLYTTPGSNSIFNINFDITSLESFITGSTAKSGKMNIPTTSGKVGNLRDGDTILNEVSYNKMYFSLPSFGPTKYGTAVTQYYYKKQFQNRTFTAGVGTATTATGETFSGNGLLSTTQKLDNFLIIVVDNQGASEVSNGQILSFTTSGRTINIASNTATFTANISNTFICDILATVIISSGTELNPKSKTLISANTTNVGSSYLTANGTMGNTSVYLPIGQIQITTPNRTASGNDSLFISDVKTLQKVYDFGTTTITQANLSSATDITSRYRLDTGQRDNIYDHGSILLKNGVTPPTGPILICVDYYTHDSGTSDGLGFFSVDSYPSVSLDAGYLNVSTYTSTTDGTATSLRDVIDFRPRRQDASNTTPSYTLSGIRIPNPNSDLEIDYQYYLPRVDKIVITKDRNFDVISGISAQYPVAPSDLSDGMTLYTLYLPAYTPYSSNVTIRYHEWKRYTMRDIGALEKRITALEYYSSLSLLEKEAQAQLILDGNGLDRTKYGTLVDSFKGHNIGDVLDPDYFCAIDFERNECLPPFNPQSNKLNYVAGSNITKNGNIISPSYTETPAIIQNTASFSVSVNDYLIARFKGAIHLNPESDLWKDIQQAPDVIVNANGENDAWEAIIQVAEQANRNSFGTRWNEWQTIWSGIPTTFIEGLISPPPGAGALPIIERTTTVQTLGQTRTGVSSRLTTDTITQNIGDVVKDVSVIPFMRSVNIHFIAEALRPNRQMYFFFDGTDVKNYVQRANELSITYTNSNKFLGVPGISELITANNGITAFAIFNYPPKINIESGNTATLFISEANSSGKFITSGTIIGNTSGATATITGYIHYSGTANTVSSGNTNSIVLQDGASTTEDFYVGNTIYLVSGSGIGQSGTISSYNVLTKRAIVSTTWSVSPSSNTKYSIGPLKTNIDGTLAGTFIVPSQQE